MLGKVTRFEMIHFYIQTENYLNIDFNMYIY